MKPEKIKDGIYWVGAIDWDLRNFHGYTTNRGSSYNSYLIVDEKVVLVDGVKDSTKDQMFARISQIIDPSKIDMLVVNHVEMDHSGAVPYIMEFAPNAEIIASKNGISGLKKHYGEQLGEHYGEQSVKQHSKQPWKFREVKTGDSINIGKRNLEFFLMPMVHWPDSMATYIPEDKVLLPNDAFGQHIASYERFDDEIGEAIFFEEAKKYYANIVLPYGAQVSKALEALGTLDIDTICPSHGVVLRKNIAKMYENYASWSSNKTNHSCVIVYDSMWHSTEKIAKTIYEAFEKKGVNTVLCNLQVTHISDVMAHIIDAEYICIGSPTLNNNMLPTVAAFCTYLKGLAPKNRKYIAFGSYGWGGQSIGMISDLLVSCGCKQAFADIKINYIPTKENLIKIQNELAKNI